MPYHALPLANWPDPQKNYPPIKPGKFLTILALAGVPIICLAILRATTGASFFELMREPNAVAAAPAYIGFFAQVGLFFWAGTASICLLASRALVHDKSRRQLSQLFLILGLFFILLTIDDAFMLHESIGGLRLAKLLHLSDHRIQAAYGLFFGWLMFRYRALIANSDHRPFLLAMASYSIMVSLDIADYQAEARIFLEDSFKLLGTTSLMAYFAGIYLKTITPAPEDCNAEAANI